jgi:hypothetical protein
MTHNNIQTDTSRQAEVQQARQNRSRTRWIPGRKRSRAKHANLLNVLSLDGCHSSAAKEYAKRFVGAATPHRPGRRRAGCSTCRPRLKLSTARSASSRSRFNRSR